MSVKVKVNCKIGITVLWDEYSEEEAAVELIEDVKESAEDIISNIKDGLIDGSVVIGLNNINEDDDYETARHIDIDAELDVYDFKSYNEAVSGAFYHPDFIKEKESD